MDDKLVVTDRHRNPASLRNLYANCASFLVCGGPSLKDYPLERLRERGVLAMGVNNAAGMAPCNMFVHGDPPFKFHHGLWFDPKMMCFTPLQKLKKRTTITVRLADGRFMKSRVKLEDCPNVFGFQRESRFDPETFLSGESAQWGNNTDGAAETGRPKKMYTMLLAIRLLHYLGVRRVYMLGVDFTMPMTGDAYAFAQDRSIGERLSNNGEFGIVNDHLKELRPRFEAAGFYLFNCLKRSGCTAFDHVSFDDALRDCRNGVPLEPFNLSGWYEKRVDVQEGDADAPTIQCARATT